jgi:hypothetical protein
MARGPRALTAVGLALIASIGCKAGIGDDPLNRGSGGGGGGGGTFDGGDLDSPVGATDAAVDALVIDAPLGNFSTPAPVPIAATSKGEDDPVLSSDGLQLIYAIDDTAGGTGKDFFLSTRATTTAAFGTPAALTTLNTSANEESPRLSPDDKTLFYASGGVIMSATRPTATGAFGAGTPVTYLSSGSAEKWFHSCDSGYYLVTQQSAADGTDFLEGTVGTAPSRVVTELNSTGNEISTDLSPDCLTVTWASTRDGNNTVHIFEATRPTVTAHWNAPVADTSFGLTADDEDLYITPNGHFAVLASTRGPTATKDIFTTSR